MKRAALAILAVSLIPACNEGDETVIIQQLTDSGPFKPDVVFQMERDVSPINELWGADLEGTKLVRLSGPVQNLGNVFSWAWSPDREWLAFISDKELDSAFAVYMVRTTGPGVALRASTYFAGMGTPLYWAPDSSRIAFLGNNGTTTDLYTVKPTDFNAAVQVSGTLVTDGNIGDVEWAPDSSRIAYVADQDIDGVAELYTSLPAGGGNVKVCATLASGQGVLSSGGAKAFYWAPDSSRIAYQANQDNPGWFELYTTLPTGPGSIVRVSAPITSIFDQVSSFVWSPTSDRIAYSAGLTTFAAWTCPPATSGGAVKVSGAGNSGELAWAPNGSRLAWRETGNVYSASPTGAGLATVNGALTAGGSVNAFGWAPDSSRIAYVADQDINDEIELYTSLPAGGGNVKVSPPLNGGDCTFILWSPDAAWIAFAANVNSPTLQYFITRPTNATQVLQVTHVVSGSVSGFGRKWTSNGSHFVFDADEQIDGVQELFAANPVTGAVIKISGPTLSTQSMVFSFTPR